MNHTSLLIFLVLITSCKVESEKKELKNDQIPTTTNLISKVDTIRMSNAPSRISRKIRKGKNGKLIIAAFQDVILYDGETFTSIPKVRGIESVDAFDAIEDSKGNIWIASTSYGVFRYDGEDYTQFTTDSGLVHNRTMDLYEDRSGKIWIATMGGVSCYNGTAFQNFTKADGLTENDVNTIIEDSAGRMWFGTRGNACFYDPRTATFTELIREDDMPFSNVWSIIEDSHKNIWIGDKNGLWRYDGDKYSKYSSEFTNSIYEDKNGNIWASSPGGSLKRYDGESLLDKKILPVKIYTSKSMTFGLTEDRKGHIWIGHLRGVLRYDGKSIHYFKSK